MDVELVHQQRPDSQLVPLAPQVRPAPDSYLPSRGVRVEGLGFRAQGPSWSCPQNARQLESRGADPTARLTRQQEPPWSEPACRGASLQPADCTQPHSWQPRTARPGRRGWTDHKELQDQAGLRAQGAGGQQPEDRGLTERALSVYRSRASYTACQGAASCATWLPPPALTLVPAPADSFCRLRQPAR